ncbi:MAG: M20/M25/M40 family metallo-hydrolase [Anaerolineae bacterium]|nr:M20/M25/M40 family metallo-hydrolase [Anaerolineae bacterium]
MTALPAPSEVLKRLIQFDTTNPPGNEAACIQYIQSLLNDVGIKSQIYEKVAGRPNLVARLQGTGNAAPLLLYGHVDVVTTASQQWTYPPFDAVEADGYIWGRGALDMKGGVAMMVSAFLRAKEHNSSLNGDVILCILSDEEAGGRVGAKFMVDEHPTLFEGVKYALGEFGGFTLYIGGKRFYPIMIAEKQLCAIRATVQGAAGHGSMPIRGAAMAKLARMLTLLDKKRLPVHITPAVRLMMESLANGLSGAPKLMIKQLLNPMLTDTILDLMGEQGRTFDPMLHNTVSPTILEASNKINVIPAQVTLEMDGRLLPSLTPDVILREVQSLVGDDVQLDIINHDPYPSEPDMGLFATLANILRQADSTGIPLPLVLPGVTDGRFFAQLGIQTYGFLPMQLPQDFNFSATIHAANERIPTAALEFGTQAILQVLEQSI